MNGLVIALLVSLCSIAPAFAKDRQPPQAHCMDATRVTDATQVDDQTLALLLSDGTRFRLSFQQACDTFDRKQGLRLLGRNGWICGDEGEALRTDAGLCPVADVQPMDARGFAELLRERDQRRDIETLQGVTVTQPRAKGFIGTTDYCVSSQALRSWRDESEHSVVVEVNPRHSGGHRYYRLEMAQSCGNLTNAETLQLVSGVGLGMVCGHPGDRVMLSRPQPAWSGTEEKKPLIRPVMQSELASSLGCRIARVYPITEG